MHNGQRRGAVKGARLNLIIKFYDYSGREHAAHIARCALAAAKGCGGKKSVLELTGTKL